MSTPNLKAGENPTAVAAAEEHAKALLATGMAYEFAPQTIATRAFLDGFALGAANERERAAVAHASLIASNTTLRRERREARNQIAELAKVTAERNDWKIRAEEMDGYKADCMALRARVAELVEKAERYRLTTLLQDARIAELVAEIERWRTATAKLRDGADESARVATEQLARAESATLDHIRDAAKMVPPAKHPDTALLDSFEAMHGSLGYCDADEAPASWCAYGYAGHPEGVGHTLREAIAYAVRKQGGAQ